MPFTNISNDEHFQNKLTSAGGDLVVVDFTATWCGPCQMIATHFEELSNRYAGDAIFLKVDVDQCQATAGSQSVTSMPTFVFYRNRLEITRFSGANVSALESKIKEQIALNPTKSDDCGIPGHFNLIPAMIVDSSCECLNEADDHPLSNCLNSDTGFLESDVDEQLILSLTFSQSVRLHSIVIKGPADKGAKHIRIFINQPQTLDFDQVTGYHIHQGSDCEWHTGSVEICEISKCAKHFDLHSEQSGRHRNHRDSRVETHRIAYHNHRYELVQENCRKKR